MTIGLKGFFHHMIEMQLRGWILIKDLFSLALEICPPSHSSSPAQFVPSSTQNQSMKPSSTLGDGELYPKKYTDLTHKKGPSYYQGHKTIES